MEASKEYKTQLLNWTSIDEEKKFLLTSNCSNIKLSIRPPN